jgi:hypothetical protein
MPMPKFCQIINIMFGEEYKKEILKSLSDNNISQCVQDMSLDTESQVIANIKEADILCHPVGRVN